VLNGADLFRRKPSGDAVADQPAVAPDRALKRTLGAFDLTLLGVGAIVGAGIFSSVGQMAAGAPGQPAAGPGRADVANRCECCARRRVHERWVRDWPGARRGGLGRRERLAARDP